MPARAASIPSADELIGRAKALAPKLRERAVRAERERNIPRESVEEYLASGLIHTLQPRRWGGYEHDHETAFNIAIELGRSTCGSSARCLTTRCSAAGATCTPSHVVRNWDVPAENFGRSEFGLGLNPAYPMF